MKRKFYSRFLGLLLGFAMSTSAGAQDDGGVSLGVLARSLRKAKDKAVHAVIDNDNLSRVMDDAETHRLNGTPLFTMKASSNNFEMSSPDGTCSLSFNANAAALLTSPYVADELPANELAKLDGPATLDGDTLQVAVYNGTDWNVKEIIVGLTIVSGSENAGTLDGVPKLLAAAEDLIPSQKKPDLTLLFHLKGSAVPFATTIFRGKLTGSLAPDQEWHWAIVQAKGIRPGPLPVNSGY